ncbi:DUF6508 domain-containing protein [Sporosarcina ureae]|uniref:Uncharacterized protein n=1 Tax=Sporosarcina ureae TaxID=1571 RepID=A0ABM6JS00_SPOUR|nr:DUF6508 domain-containing protein [Sporosarcina ureae]ARF12981.1 hypothetical protein SporoS204_01600 [Sporosarcina ureae]
MTRWRKLYQHLPYFEQAAERNPESFITEELLFHAEYEQDLNEFLRDYHDLDWTDTRYPNTLEAAGISTAEQMAVAIPIADMKVLKALLTRMVREERFAAGALAQYASNGMVADVLCRLKETDTLR